MALDKVIQQQLSAARLRDPFAHLGLHRLDHGWVVRCFWPGAEAVELLPLGGGEPVAMTAAEGCPGLFEGMLDASVEDVRYELRYRFPTCELRTRDPYSFWPQIDDWDLARFSEGRHHNIEDILGALPCTVDGCDGVRFAVWAPNAQRVSVIGEWNGWDGRIHPMRPRHPVGVWEIFVPGVAVGASYKFEILGADDTVKAKIDPYARAAQRPPETASVVDAAGDFAWNDREWMEARAEGAGGSHERPMSIYECHLGSWQRDAQGKYLNYRELGERLAEHCRRCGFTHIELLPVAAHPFAGSWGYQVMGQYAPTPRFGQPDDLRAFVDILHGAGIGVLVDYVPAHFPKDEWGLVRYDGSACYEYDDPREGEHRDWDTLIFNYRRPEVRNLLLGSALYWLRSYHIDGLRVDAVSAMLYRNYSRDDGDWIANEQGGNANNEAVSFLQELNALVHMLYPGVITAAEESTAWQGVTAPTDWDGLGFDLKWNMGWMHDTLRYLGQDPVLRPGCHEWATFHQWYAYDERWILPLSHDEVVHGKGSLLDKMWGDYHQRIAQLRLLIGYQVAVPGRPLLFQGCEFGMGPEWNYQESLPWHEAEEDARKGLMAFVAAAMHCYRQESALHRLDDQRQGFQWIDVENRAESILAFLRCSHDGPNVLVACNFTPIERHDYPLFIDQEGRWELILDSDPAAHGHGGDAEARRQQDGRIAMRVFLPALSIRFWRAPG